jgi:hypothetical protein
MIHTTESGVAVEATVTCSASLEVLASVILPEKIQIARDDTAAGASLPEPSVLVFSAPSARYLPPRKVFTSRRGATDLWEKSGLANRAMIKPVAAFVRPSTEEILAGELRLQDAVSNIAHVFSTGVHIRSEAGTVSTGTAEALQATCPSDHTTYSILVNLGEALFLSLRLGRNPSTSPPRSVAPAYSAFMLC